MTVAEPLDDEMMFGVFGRDPVLLGRIGPLFVAQYDHLFEQLDAAIVSTPSVKIESSLHSLKGMAGLVGAAEAIDAIARLEALLAGTGDTPITRQEAITAVKAYLAPHRIWFSRWLPNES